MFPGLLGGMISPISAYTATMGFVNPSMPYFGAGSPNVYSLPGGQSTPFGIGKSIGDLFDKDPSTGRSKGNFGSAAMGLMSLGLLGYSIVNQFNTLDRLANFKANYFPWSA